jgi:hypothetical protein
MPIVEYTPNRFGDLSEMVAQVSVPMNLAHRPFVDYYYTTNDACRLYLYYSDAGKVIGTMGRELARFLHNGREMTIRIASNWYSLQRGVGGELYQHTAEANPNSVGLMFSGSQDTLTILRHHNWFFMPGVHGYFLNNPVSIYPNDSWWRSAVKGAIRRMTRRKISAFASRIPTRVNVGITVREEKEYTDDLLPSQSAFTFRLAPTAEYLNWRYNLSLPFVRYRLFRIVARGKSAGYAILSDSPDKILVAQCDAEDVDSLANGILLSILEVGRDDREPRTVFLTSSNPGMVKIFRKFGFWRQRGPDLPFAFRTRPPEFDLNVDTSQWLINFDWGDNGMRPPFLDQLSSA